MKQYIRDDTQGDTLGDGVQERHREDRDVCRDRLEQVIPLYLYNLLDHQESDDDQCRSGREARDRQEDRGEEQREQEEETRNDRGETGTATLCDTGAGLNEGRDGGRTEAGTYHGTDGVCEQCALDLRKLAILIEHVCLGSAADQGSECIEDIDEQECEQYREEVKRMLCDDGEIKLEQGRCDRCRHGNDTGRDQAVEAGIRIRYVDACQLAEDTEDPGHEDTDEDVTLHTLDNEIAGDDDTDQCQQYGDTL